MTLLWPCKDIIQRQDHRLPALLTTSVDACVSVSGVNFLVVSAKSLFNMAVL